MKANEWIATDRAAVEKDIARLGIDGAARYQMDLIEDRMASGDARWADISEDDMRAALVALGGGPAPDDSQDGEGTTAAS